MRIFFEGFEMGSRLSHTVGIENHNSNLFIVGWSKTVGDLRVAHFIGMHALQVIPVFSYYILKNTKATIFIAILYFFIGFIYFISSVKWKPFFQTLFKN